MRFSKLERSRQPLTFMPPRHQGIRGSSEGAAILPAIETTCRTRAEELEFSGGRASHAIAHEFEMSLMRSRLQNSGATVGKGGGYPTICNSVSRGL